MMNDDVGIVGTEHHNSTPFPPHPHRSQTKGNHYRLARGASEEAEEVPMEVRDADEVAPRAADEEDPESAADEPTDEMRGPWRSGNGGAGAA